MMSGRREGRADKSGSFDIFDEIFKSACVHRSPCRNLAQQAHEKKAVDTTNMANGSRAHETSEKYRSNDFSLSFVDATSLHPSVLTSLRGGNILTIEPH
jgi:ABC-type phosphate transport system substrate-binding protein